MEPLKRNSHGVLDPAIMRVVQVCRIHAFPYLSSPPSLGIQFIYVLQELLKLESSPLKILLAGQGLYRHTIRKGYSTVKLPGRSCVLLSLLFTLVELSAPVADCRIAVIDFPRCGRLRFMNGRMPL